MRRAVALNLSRVGVWAAGDGGMIMTFLKNNSCLPINAVLCFRSKDLEVTMKSEN